MSHEPQDSAGHMTLHDFIEHGAHRAADGTVHAGPPPAAEEQTVTERARVLPDGVPLLVDEAEAQELLTAYNHRQRQFLTELPEGFTVLGHRVVVVA